MHIIYLFKTIVSKAWSSSSVFFLLIINKIFHGVSILWILKVFRFYLAVKLAFLNTLGKIKTFLLTFSWADVAVNSEASLCSTFFTSVNIK